MTTKIVTIKKLRLTKMLRRVLVVLPVVMMRMRITQMMTMRRTKITKMMRMLLKMRALPRVNL